MRKLPREVPADAFPADMGIEERGIRQSLYAAWRRSADEFAAQLGIAADFFADRNHPDEAVCRAAWATLRNRQPSPGGWWRWHVKPAEPVAWDIRRAGLRGRKHNDRLWLCWPPGWVRLTGGYLLRDGYEPVYVEWGGVHFYDQDAGRYWSDFVPDAWLVCVQPHATRYGTPTERQHGRVGWTALFHPPGTQFEPARVQPPQPSLFAEADI
jgi:hypothetical protein